MLRDLQSGWSICQSIVAGRVDELEVSVPLWFDLFDEHDILPGRLADDLQHIPPGQGPESKVALTVGSFLAYGGLPNLVYNFFEGEALFRIGEVVVAC